MSAPPTDTSVDVQGAHPQSHGHREPPGWLRPAAVIVSIIPIWSAVIVDGLRGTFPYADAATTVNRARDVFGGAFPLVGMPAAAATSAGYQAYFPGAWQLYVVAVPTQLFGDVWGPPVAMALLNSLWVALAGWLLFRRLRTAEALVGMALLAVLLWSLGSGFLVTPVPMDMVVIPMALFLIAVWAVADGDVVAIPVLAVVANFLWLDHLVLVVTIPLVGSCALIGLWAWMRRIRNDDPDGRLLRRRRLRRALVGAALITVIMWIPPLIQQVTTHPGNLRVLIASAGVDRPSIGSWPTAIHNVVSVVVRPPFWFRGTLDDPSFLRAPVGTKLIDELDVLDACAGAVLVGAMVLLGLMARRRHDRSGLWLLIVAGAALVLAVVSTQSAPSYFGPPTGYLRSLWPTAMFVWFALVVNGVRAVGPRWHRALVAPAAVVVVLFTALNVVPVHVAGEQRRQAVVAEMNASVLAHVRGARMVELSSEVGFATHDMSAALALALRSAGVPYCVPRREADGIERLHICRSDHPDRVVTVAVTARPHREGAGEVLVRASLLDDDEQAELARLSRRVEAWLDRQDRLRVTAAAMRRLQAEPDSTVKRQVLGLLGSGTPAGEVSPTDTRFRGIVGYWYASNIDDPAPLFPNSPLDRHEWQRWLDLSGRNLTLVVTERAGD